MAATRRKRILRWGLLAVVLLLTTLVVLYVAVLPGYVGGRIEVALREAGVQGAKFEVASVTWRSTRLDNVSLANSAGGGGREWLRAKSIEADYGLNDLWNLRVGEVTVTGAAWTVRERNGEAEAEGDGAIDWGFPAGDSQAGSDPGIDLPLNHITLRECVVNLERGDGRAAVAIPVEGVVSRSRPGHLQWMIDVVIAGEARSVVGGLRDQVGTVDVEMQVLDEVRRKGSKFEFVWARSSVALPHVVQATMDGLHFDLAGLGVAAQVGEMSGTVHAEFGEDFAPVNIMGRVEVASAVIGGQALRGVSATWDRAADGDPIMTMAGAAEFVTVNALIVPWHPLVEAGRGEETIITGMVDATAVVPQQMRGQLSLQGVSLDGEGVATLKGRLRATVASDDGVEVIGVELLDGVVEISDVSAAHADSQTTVQGVTASIPLQAMYTREHIAVSLREQATLEIAEASVNPGEVLVGNGLEFIIHSPPDAVLAQFDRINGVWQMRFRGGMQTASPVSFIGKTMRETIEQLDLNLTASMTETTALRGSLRLDLGECVLPPFTATSGTIVAEMSDLAEVRFTEVAVDLGEHGRFRADPFKVNLNDGLVTMDVACEDLSFGMWLQLLSQEKMTGEGTLNGRVKIALDPFNRQRRFSFGNGYLVADPPTGWFQASDAETIEQLVEEQLQGRALDAALQQVQERIMQALQDFSFTSLYMNFEPVGDEVTLQVESTGKGRHGEEPIEFGSLRLNINEFERVFNEVLNLKSGYDALTD